MRSVPINFAAALVMICLLVGCTRPSAPATRQPTEPVTAVPATPQSAETLAFTSPLITPPTATLSVPQSTGTPAVSLVSVGDVMANPEAFRDRLVHMRGHGLVTATFPLCKGYIGLDRRTRFVEAAGAEIVADVKWQPPPNTRMYDPDNLRTFEGYIRIFRGEIGCPGAVSFETFPYFEVLNVVE